MSKPADVPQKAWLAAFNALNRSANPEAVQEVIARAIMAAKAEALADEREHCASLVEEYCAQMNHKGRDKMLLTIVARAIRRGRNWTPQEQIGFLVAFMAEEKGEG